MNFASRVCAGCPCVAAVAFALNWVAYPASASTITPTYSLTAGDATTGDNAFFANGGTRWNVDPGADDYFNETYERPTAQTYENRNKPGVGVVAAANEYFGYVDLKEGSYGYDDQYMYFQLVLYTGVRQTDDGTIDGESFGSGTQYGVRFSDQDPDGADGFLLRVAGDSKELWSSTFVTKSAEGFYDTDGDVGGPGGVAVVNEGTDGYETERVKSDGGLENDTDTKVMFARILGPEDGEPIDPSIMPVVEIVFDYAQHNAAYPGSAIDPAGLQYLDFEADRGLKDNANYFWNDEYSFTEAGTPYDASNQPQNIYELDTLRLIPEPAVGLFFALSWLVINASGRTRRPR
ncbi:MAG: hypothetical protein AAGE65_09745 [Planctomycetota bacterium]